jgi:hypothetical protein
MMIGEFGDLSASRNTKYAKQVQLFQRLDLSCCVWELDCGYPEQSFKFKQDAYAWNCEEMSVLKSLEPSV